MIFIEILFAACMALLFTLIFFVGLQKTGPWSSMWTFFLIILLASWAGELWIGPVGPMFLGIYWLPMILIAFIFAILLSGTTRPRRQPKVETISSVKKEEAEKEKAFDIFFWILVLGLAAIILLRYLSSR